MPRREQVALSEMFQKSFALFSSLSVRVAANYWNGVRGDIEALFASVPTAQYRLYATIMVYVRWCIAATYKTTSFVHVSTPWMCGGCIGSMYQASIGRRWECGVDCPISQCSSGSRATRWSAPGSLLGFYNDVCREASDLGLSTEDVPEPAALRVALRPYMRAAKAAWKARQKEV